MPLSTMQSKMVGWTNVQTIAVKVTTSDDVDTAVADKIIASSPSFCACFTTSLGLWTASMDRLVCTWKSTFIPFSPPDAGHCTFTRFVQENPDNPGWKNRTWMP